MKGYFFLVLFLIAMNITAQEKVYQCRWQQQANYTITVTLNDDSNYLIAKETIEYFNNSPDSLNEILIHLYPNAYKDNSTAYAKQKIAQKDTKFWMAEAKDRGYIDNLNFETEGRKIELIYSRMSPDCAKLKLPYPLLPRHSIKMSTPFNVKIPYTFSRLGHVGKSYQISQWFPKIAVYDVNGWNQMPYLDQGEFYSDFGNYDVTITLPKNYIVAATGNLMDAKEEEWINRRAEIQKKIIDEFGNSETKTIRFTESNIHDFAFFADKRWCIAKEEITLPSGKKTTAWAFDTIAFAAKLGINYIRKTIIYLSEHVGEYPYQTVKSCTGALVAGAGMEYPTITIVGHQNETEVVHEIGHNWFYGILGSNERRYAWMDEGINSFYQLQICTEKESTPYNKAYEIFTGKDFVPTNENLELMIGKINSSRGEDAPVTLNSPEYSDANYGALIYSRVPLNLNYLREYLGAPVFDSCMKNYFINWHHRHPLPGDIKTCFENISGKYLDWFFDGMLNDNQNYDIKITKVILEDKNREMEIHLKNKSRKAITVPVKFSGHINSTTQWLQPFTKDTVVHFHNNEYSRIEVNDKPYFVETNINNNTYFLYKRHGKALPLQFRFGAGLENKYHRTVFWSPVIGYNTHNKTMLGIAFYNSTLVRKKLEFALVPLFSFTKKNLDGYATVSYTFMPRNRNINTWNFGIINAKFNSNINSTLPITYIRTQPYVQINFTKPTNGSRLERFIRLDYTRISQKQETVNDTLLELITDKTQTQYLNLEFCINNKTLLNPYKVKIWVEKNPNNNRNNFLKIGLKAQYQISYENPKKKLSIDFFTGKVFYQSKDKIGNYDFYLGSENAYSDYKYWYATIDRDPGLRSHQIFNEQGGIRTNILPFNTANLSATLRFRTHLPFTNFIRPYLDFGSYKGMYDDLKIKFFYTSGISIVLVEDALEINFPLAFTHTYSQAGNSQTEVIKFFRFTQSKSLNESMATGGINYWQTITFILNLEKLNPLNLIRNLPLGK